MNDIRAWRARSALSRAIVRTFDAETREAMLDALYALRRVRWTRNCEGQVGCMTWRFMIVIESWLP